MKNTRHSSCKALNAFIPRRIEADEWVTTHQGLVIFGSCWLNAYLKAELCLSLEYLPCYPGTCLGVGEGVVVVLHAEAAGLGDGLELVVRQGGKLATGDTKRVEELIVGIVHPIDAEDGLEAALVEGSVVGHKGQTLYQRLYLCPDFREDGGIFCVFPAKAMNLRTPVVVVVRLGLNEGVEGIDYLAVPNDNDTNRADAAALVVGGLKINCCKIFHLPFNHLLDPLPF